MIDGVLDDIFDTARVPHTASGCRYPLLVQAASYLVVTELLSTQADDLCRCRYLLPRVDNQFIFGSDTITECFIHTV
jgi:hypothetical protein